MAPFPAAAPAPLATPKIRIAITNIGAAPNRSVSRPPTIRNPANNTAYALTTRGVTAGASASPRAMLGRARQTME